MTEKNYIFADVPVTISAHDPYVTRMCREYEAETPGVRIEATPEEIERERAGMGEDFPGGYLESLAVYRKICEEMLFFHTFLFHGSAVEVDGEAYLFTAPSGTGKSTHVRLWRERFGERAVVINDDKPLIQVRREAVFVCGTPWSGKHHLDSNRKAPLRAVCLLERGTENHVERIAPADGYPALFRQTYRPKDREKMKRTLELLGELAKRVPLYRMRCDVSQEAVTAAWEAMGTGKRKEKRDE